MNLPPLAELLTADGDARIIPGPDGRNRYGRTVTPSADLAFGSSTASSISQGAWEAVAARRDVWLSDRRAPDEVFADAADSIRERFSAHYGLRDTAIILTPSGTDAHLLAALLLAGPHDAPLACLSVEPSETGSGAPLALAARRFSGDGGVLSYGDRAETIAVPARDPDGNVRPQDAVMADLNAQIATCDRAGRQALLVVADVSKTGLIAPHPQAVRDLKARWGGRLDVLVDACQLRLSPASLRAYLDQGFMVAVTGSKFVAGPAFSGMLLIPGAIAKRLSRRTLPILPELGHAAMWPKGFAAQDACSGPPAFGLLARWEAALFEMDRFFAFDEALLARTTQRLSAAFQARLSASTVLKPLSSPPLARAHPGWDCALTILPFMPAAPCPGGVQIGQPVRIGDLQAVRLCLSMPLIARAAASEAGLRAVLSEGEAAISAIETSAQTLASKRQAG